MATVVSAGNAPNKHGFFHSARARQEAFNAYLFIAPYLLVTIVFTIGVILFAFYISFTSFNLYTPPTWVGLSNYSKAFTPTGQFIHSLVNVIWYVAIVVSIQTALAPPL